MKQLLVLLSALVLYTACNNADPEIAEKKKDTIACPPGGKVDVATIERITGMSILCGS